MQDLLRIGDLVIDVVRKDVKNIHLSVKPPNGLVAISAPLHVSDNAIRAYAIGKLKWIRQQQSKLGSQPRETPRDYLERESHYVWGRRCLLAIVEHHGSPRVDVRHNRLVLSVRNNTHPDQRAEIIERWFRDQLREAAMPMIAHWQSKLGVVMRQLFVQRMKTRWGSCNPTRRTIRLNTDLAKKPPECLEYILVHELLHIIEPSHNAKFVGLMDTFLPNWRHRREQLNALPVRHADWDY